MTEFSIHTSQPLKTWSYELKIVPVILMERTLSQSFYVLNIPAPIAQLVECPLRGTGDHRFDPGPRHTKVIKKWYWLLLAWHSDLRGRARTGRPSVRIM